MARNEEKAQSMLYRFREAQAAELGLGTRSDRRPRMASACKSLRDCERWRGEILREISRKVSKIQDAGLTDYEIRDLNDEINKLLREKRHWENQIVALGGANYRRNVAMLDEDGKEVPGTKGYKYFGRAKELPGVKELFEGRKKEEEEENIAQNYYKKFTSQGPAYYGDLDEQDGKLLEFEQQTEDDEWEEAYNNLRGALGLSPSGPTPKPPRINTPPALAVTSNLDHPTEANTSSAKRKADSSQSDIQIDASTQSTEETNKRTKTITASSQTPPSQTDSDSTVDASVHIFHAQAAAKFIPFLTPEHLMPPKLPSNKEMENVLLDLKKRALLDEYFGTENAPTGTPTTTIYMRLSLPSWFCDHLE